MVFAAFCFAFDPAYTEFLEKLIPNFQYVLGLTLLAGLFLEYAATATKINFIYSSKSVTKKRIPIILQLTFFPRLLIAGALLAIVFQGIDLLSRTDFMLLPIVLYAATKEFWVRRTLMNIEHKPSRKVSGNRVVFSEVLFFLFISIAYISLWEIFLLESPKVMKRAIQPENYPFFFAAMLLLLYSLSLPGLMEEHFRSKKRGQKVAAWLSFILPALGFVFQLFRMKYLS